MSAPVDNPITYQQEVTIHMSAHVFAIDSAPMPTSERCDRCSAQAQVKAYLPAGSLLFCAHHAEAAYPRLLEVATTIDDYRPYLVAQEKSTLPATL